jgi:hypothetical protein
VVCCGGISFVDVGASLAPSSALQIVSLLGAFAFTLELINRIPSLRRRSKLSSTPDRGPLIIVDAPIAATAINASATGLITNEAALSRVDGLDVLVLESRL